MENLNFLYVIWFNSPNVSVIYVLKTNVDLTSLLPSISNISNLEKGVALHLNKLEFPSPKDSTAAMAQSVRAFASHAEVCMFGSNPRHTYVVKTATPPLHA